MDDLVPDSNYGYWLKRKKSDKKIFAAAVILMILLVWTLHNERLPSNQTFTGKIVTRPTEEAGGIYTMDVEINTNAKNLQRLEVLTHNPDINVGDQIQVITRRTKSGNRYYIDVSENKKQYIGQIGQYTYLFDGLTTCDSDSELACLGKAVDISPYCSSGICEYFDKKWLIVQPPNQQR